MKYAAPMFCSYCCGVLDDIVGEDRAQQRVIRKRLKADICTHFSETWKQNLDKMHRVCKIYLIVVISVLPNCLQPEGIQPARKISQEVTRHCLTLCYNSKTRKRVINYVWQLSEIRIYRHIRLWRTLGFAICWSWAKYSLQKPLIPHFLAKM